MNEPKNECKGKKDSDKRLYQTSKPDSSERSIQQKNELGSDTDNAERSEDLMEQTNREVQSLKMVTTPSEKCQNTTELLSEAQKLYSLMGGDNDCQAEDVVLVLKKSQKLFLDLLNEIEGTIWMPPKNINRTEKDLSANDACSGKPRIKTLLYYLEELQKKTTELTEKTKQIQTQFDERKKVDENRTAWYKKVQEDYVNSQQTEDDIPDFFSEEERRALELLKNAWKRRDNEIKRLEKEADYFRQRRDNEIKRLEKEADYFRQRLSRMTDAKMTDGNPNITDLNDPNSAMKLAERYKELNDNEWSDAFETLTGEKYDQKNAIKLLCEIVMECYRECIKHSEDQWRNLIEILTKTETKNADKTLKEIGFQEAEFKDLKNLRKMAAKKSSEGIIAQVKEYLRERLDEKEKMVTQLNSYIEGCIRLTWYMAVQDPPLYIFSLQQGDHSRDMFKAFTENGKRVSYVVWPCLLRHKGGPLLVRGTCQFCT